MSELDNCESLKNARDAVKHRGARADIDCQNWPSIPTDSTTAWCYVAHSVDSIYIVFEADEDTVRAVVDADLGPVSSDSCFEFFVSPDPESGRYWNFEFNAVGRLNSSHRIVRPEPTRLTAAELGSVERYPSLGVQTFESQHIDGPWSLTVRIPFELINVRYQGSPIRMRGNFYKCASAKDVPHYLSWAPIATDKPDFHRPEFFGTLIFD